MNRPRVIIHNLISLDGHLDGFPADAGLYYEIASWLPHQAVLTGSGTMPAAATSGISTDAVSGGPGRRRARGWSCRRSAGRLVTR